MDPTLAKKLQVLSTQRKQARASSVQSQASESTIAEVSCVVSLAMPLPDLVDKRDRSLPPTNGLAEAVLELKVGSTDLATGAMAMPVDSMMEPTMEATLPASSVKVAVGDSTIRVIEVMKTAKFIAPIGSTEVKEAIPAISLFSVDAVPMESSFIQGEIGFGMGKCSTSDGSFGVSQSQRGDRQVEILSRAEEGC
ncbi:hypothetical protein COCNU_scaffold016954G000020 [Cocos nucifera]|nr:hypothetical protein [Cocos nucifera]